MLRNILRCTIKSVQSRTRPNAMLLQPVNQNLVLKCKYARWAHRRPVKIVNEDELYDSDDSDSKPSQRRIPRNQRKRVRQEKSVDSQKDHEMSMDVEEEEETLKDLEEIKTDVQTSYASKLKKQNIPEYISIFEEDNYTISKLMLEVKGRKQRRESRKIILEGNILIKDAIDAGVILETVLFSRPNDIKSLNIPDGVNVYKVPYRTIRTWSNLSTSPGVLAVAKAPNVEEIDPPDNALPLTIVCDNVREPGNLGTILRTAAAVGCEKLIVLKGCVDIWDSKVLRSGAGAHFRTRIHPYQTWDDVILTLSNSADFLIADSNMLINDESEMENVMVEMMNEEYQEENDEDKNSNNDDNDIDNKLATESITDGLIEDLAPNFQNKYFAESRKGRRIINKFMSRLPIIPYYDVDYTMNETVLIITGETAGVSFQTYNALRQKRGMRIHIPLCERIDSLNNGMALAVIAFEIKRQFLLKQKLQDVDDAE